MDLTDQNRIFLQSMEQSNLAHTISAADGERELLYVNERFVEDTGYSREESVGRNCRFLQGENTDPKTVDTIREGLKDFRNIDVEILNYKKDGTPFWNRLRISPVYGEDQKVIAFIGIQADVTDVRENLRREQTRQKLEALGSITANISHEIKNVLQPVKLMTETLYDWQDLEREQIENCLNILYESVAVADEVVQDVLRFSRKTPDEMAHVEIEDLYAELKRFIKNLLPTPVSFNTAFDELSFQNMAGKTTLKINQNKLFQIIINIVNNAIYAMELRGELTFEINAATVSPKDAARLDILPGEYARIYFQDNGCGMDKKVLRSAFEPFYSTKPPGEGTGLGLAISNQMIKDWGGSIDVLSEKGKGSTFILYLPLFDSINSA